MPKARVKMDTLVLCVMSTVENVPLRPASRSFTAFSSSATRWADRPANGQTEG